jgi:uncharacterized damage-inducible protein DinB
MSMQPAPLAAHFQTMARYNAMANLRLYEACAQLSDEDYRRQRSGAFRSIHLTLNHILRGDRLWIAHFCDPGVSATPALPTELYTDFASLRAAREREDARIQQFMDALDQSFLEQEVQYMNNAGRLCADPSPLLLAHLFNHQTHHRAQVQIMLSETLVKPPALDMHRIIRP